MRNRNLENSLKGKKWAYTGSVAMKLHANRLGVPFVRNIGNVNIALNNMNNVYGLTTGTRWRFNGGPPGPRSRHVVLVNNSTDKKLNVLRAGGGLASSLKNHVVFINGVPVMNLQSLLNKKVNTMNNAFNARNISKTKRNIEYLKKLLNKASALGKNKSTLLGKSPNKNTLLGKNKATALRPRRRSISPIKRRLF